MAFDLDDYNRRLNDLFGVNAEVESRVPLSSEVMFRGLGAEVARLGHALVDYNKDCAARGDLQRERLRDDDERLKVLAAHQERTQRIVDDLGNNVQAVLLACAELSRKAEQAPDQEELDTLRERVGHLIHRVAQLEEVTGEPEFKEVPVALVYDAPLPAWPYIAIKRTANGWIVSAPEWTQGGPYTIKEAFCFTDWAQLQDFCRRVLEKET
jgi:hypothetical protein